MATIRCRPAGTGCLVEAFLPMIAGKWKLLIIWCLQNDGEQRFNQLRQKLPGVTQKMLTQHLRELEEDGLVRRQVFAQVPPKVVYSLTPIGESLRPVIEAMCAWTSEHGEDVCRARKAFAGETGES
jgi:DNA-binding HxlR family transcriptional regulator